MVVPRVSDKEKLIINTINNTKIDLFFIFLTPHKFHKKYTSAEKRFSITQVPNLLILDR